eukprot:TRINITY_DN26957_c0_g1_i1.p1 TRINITY_DN26957_c0_g1~~TRINITY_DN26957_c0_g1_i1.p1  ORF type:complete len:303 (+),score=51.81 TRINITY_DN26957_c0_g1_i1:1-909(+)
MVEFPFQFAVMRKNAEDLSMLGGDGQSDVQQVAPGDFQLRRRDKAELIFWKDGFQMDYGAHRPYKFKHNRAFVQDLLDGFFPFELRDKFPKGVPLSVVDRTWELFDGTKNHRPFSQAGQGQRLGDGAFQAGDQPTLQPPALGAPNCVSMEQVNSGECNKARHQDHATNFLQQLPKNVIRNGNIIHVRDDIGNMIGQSSKSSLSTRETGSEMIVNHVQPVESNQVATLKVKFQGKTYLMKMGYTCTISKLMQDVLQLSPVCDQTIANYQLHTMYPKRSLDVLDMSPEAEGLVPNCALILQEIE